MSRYAMEWAKQLYDYDPKVRLVMLVLADDAQGSGHELRVYDDRLELGTGLTVGEADAAVRRAKDAGILSVAESHEGFAARRRIRDFRLLIPAGFRTQATSQPKHPRVDLDDVRTAVYRFYDKTGQLLYVGVSDQPETRIYQHSRDKYWWGEVVTREVTWHGSRPLAEAEEGRTIAAERPLYNIHSEMRRSSSEHEAKETRRRYVVANKPYARLMQTVDAIFEDVERGIYREQLLPEVDKLAKRIGVEAMVVRQALHYLVTEDALAAVDGDRFAWVRHPNRR